MKTTTTFQTTIKSYLDQRAADDTLFAKSYAKEGKNIGDCITYILNTVQKSGCNGFADEEIYSMAFHYYDEDKIELKPRKSCEVIVNYKTGDKVKLSESDIEIAKRKAMEEVTQQAIKAMRAKPKKRESKPTEQDAKAPQQAKQSSLF